ncbi:aminotransferase class III-fold pyridoxal phosphate-dependent enzyme, partial [Bacillus pseudomycoides]|nr:aminotransferase class III-fold pyridoxal phosphate-dependent enzyme [Bacillus pseudomycoides]
FLTEGRELEYVFFCNRGAEATESALKLSRKHTGKSLVLTFQQSLPVRSFGTLTATVY